MRKKSIILFSWSLPILAFILLFLHAHLTVTSMEIPEYTKKLAFSEKYDAITLYALYGSLIFFAATIVLGLVEVFVQKKGWILLSALIYIFLFVLWMIFMTMGQLGLLVY